MKCLYERIRIRGAIENFEDVSPLLNTGDCYVKIKACFSVKCSKNNAECLFRKSDSLLSEEVFSGLDAFIDK